MRSAGGGRKHVETEAEAERTQGKRAEGKVKMRERGEDRREGNERERTRCYHDHGDSNCLPIGDGKNKITVKK